MGYEEQEEEWGRSNRRTRGEITSGGKAELLVGGAGGDVGGMSNMMSSGG